MAHKEKNNTIRVIFCRPNEEAEIVEIKDTLESMEEIIGGAIDEYMPFSGDDQREDDIVIVCDRDGTMKKLPLCRAIEDENGQIQDAIFGPFLICYGPMGSDSYTSLPPDLEKKYLEKFKGTQLFI
jgi:hypothetical protein